MSKKMRYYLKITDNVTGEVEQDIDFSILIGGMLTEKGNASVALSQGEDAISVGTVVTHAYCVAEYVLRSLPKIVAEAVLATVKEKLDGEISELRTADGGNKLWEIGH